MIFVCDLDGTLCFDGHVLAEPIQASLRLVREAGHQLVFATARSYRDCIDLLGEDFSQELVIGLNGGLAYEAGQCRDQTGMDREAFALALSFCKLYNLPYFIDDTFNYSCNLKQDIPFISTVDSGNRAEELSLKDLTNPIKMVIYLGHHEDLLADMEHSLRVMDRLEVIYHENEKCLYLNAKDVNKATTLSRLIGDDYVAFGNDKNDLDMFRRSLYSVQVGHYLPLSVYADEQIDAHVDQVAQKLADLALRFADGGEGDEPL